MKSCDCRKRAPRDRGHYFVYDVNEYFQAAYDFPQRHTLLLQLDGLYLTSTDKAEAMMVAGRNCNEGHQTRPNTFPFGLCSRGKYATKAL